MLRTPLKDRFWSKVQKGSGCWLWQGCTNPHGYGHIAEDAPSRRMVGVHRVAWELTNGTIPEGLCVLHRCDVSQCCNPAHLFLGTHADNMADKVRKGRAWTGVQSGESNGNAKLTADQAREIRCLAAEGGTQRALARQFSISQATVSRVVRREVWKDSVSLTSTANNQVGV